ncbi:ankyrin [Anaeromyces robustus]|uniref:Ankyrin n=1 Tax=Anaeromyces robustus TaxID=1754192 RepID=A0A1Y1XLA1_9FUNG|nr:ankyrin [Anaeromyces robustus]|eukprot:ORX86540.1 ankyrin [Anaeromyces robustus]
MSLDINDNKSINDGILELIKSNNKDELEILLKFNNDKIKIDENVYNTVIINDNLEIYKLLIKYDKKDNIFLIFNKNPPFINYLFKNENYLNVFIEEISLYNNNNNNNNKDKDKDKNDRTPLLFTYFFQKYINRININENLYNLLVKYDNLEIFKFVSNNDKMENIYSLIEKNPLIFNYIFKNEDILRKLSTEISKFYCEYGFPASIKNNLNNKRTILFSKRFIMALLKKHKEEFLNYLREDYIFDNTFIIELILCFKNFHDISPNELNELINNRNSKIPFKEVIKKFISVYDYAGLKLLIIFLNKHKIIIDINEIWIRFLKLIIITNKGTSNEKKELMDLIFKYANNNNIFLDVHKKDIDGNFPLLLAVQSNNIEIIQLFIDYANENNIILNFNEKIKNKLENSITIAIWNNDMDIVNLIIDYSNKNNIILEVDSETVGNLPIVSAISNNNIKMMELLIKYANEKILIYELNGIYQFPHSDLAPIDLIIRNNNIKMLNLFMDYATKNNIIINIGSPFRNDCYPIFEAIKNNNIHIIKLLIDYANKNNMILQINQKYDDNSSPLTMAFRKNNNKIINLIFDYANNNNIILDINQKDYNFIKYKLPIEIAVENNNTKLVELLINYAEKNNILLEIKGNSLIKKAKSNGNVRIINLLSKYANQNIIELETEKNFKNPIYQCLYPLKLILKKKRYLQLYYKI